MHNEKDSCSLSQVNIPRKNTGCLKFHYISANRRKKIVMKQKTKRSSFEIQ